MTDKVTIPLKTGNVIQRRSGNASDIELGGVPFYLKEYATKEWVSQQLSGVDVTQQWVSDNYQVKGDYALRSELVELPEHLTQPTSTGVFSFDRTTNEILTLPYVLNFLDIGDVIEISGSVGNDGIYTVEDKQYGFYNTITVNYEHRNGAGSLSLSNETVNGYEVTIKRICKYWQAPLGFGQACVNLSEPVVVRAINTRYENTAGRAIQLAWTVSSQTNSNRHSLFIDGKRVFSSYGMTSAEWLTSQMFLNVIPAGVSYEIRREVGSAPTRFYFSELR